MTEKRHAAVIHSNVADAHQRKIARALTRAGFATDRAGFARTDYYGDPSSEEGVEVLGTVSNEAFARRIPVYLRALRSIRRTVAGKNVVVVFSAEHAVIVRLTVATLLKGRVRRPCIIRELADVPRAVDGAGRRATVARVTERLGARASDGFIVTSPLFVSEYVRTQLGFDGPVAVVENKPDVAPPAGSNVYAGRETLTIGYFGLLRCATTLQILGRLASHPSRRFAVVLRGFVMPDAEPTLRSFAGMFRVEGEYSSPDDLAPIYAECDLVYSGYPFDPGRVNTRLATTNRFAEAIHFGRPQIAHAGTEDGRRVQALGVGVAIDPSAVDNAVMQLLAVPDAAWADMAARAADLRAASTTFQQDFEAAMERLIPTHAVPASDPPVVPE